MWKDLPMRQRADLMHTYLKYGITSLDEMRNHYDSTISPQEKKTVTKNMSAYGGNLFYPGGEITFGRPYYSYNDKGELVLNENGKPILNYNANVPEIIVTGHSSPKKRPITTGGAGYVQPAIDPHQTKETILGSIRKRLYDNIYPRRYNNAGERLFNALILNKQEPGERFARDDMFATYLQIPQSKRHDIEGKITISKSPYSPKNADSKKEIYKIDNISNRAINVLLSNAGQLEYNPWEITHHNKKLEIGKNRQLKQKDVGAYTTPELDALGEFTLGRGFDNKGEYISYFDSWDLGDNYTSPYADQSKGIGKPFNIYDRIYLDDYYGVKQPTHATYLPEVTITGKKKKKACGGNIYDGTSEQSQKMNRPNIFKYDDGRYVYQAAPNAEEIDVTPINTLMPDASQWTYQDAEGKIYTPNTQVSTGTLTEAEDTNPLMRAANNYVRELEWRAKNDPSSIALQGKYTMPAILSPLLAPLGEAAYAAGYTPYINAGLTSAFAAHGLNHWMNEGIDSGLDAAMTAMEIVPLGGLAKPIYKGIVQPGMRLFNSPITGKWTKIGNKEYRLSPNSLGSLSIPIESRSITPQITAENAANRAQEIQELIPRYNKFAEYYGYDTVPEGVSTQEAENLIKEGLKQHNTFYRGLTYPEGEKLEAVKKVLGENASREEVMDYLAKSGSRDPNNTYFSLDERANQYARTGDVARYTRKYTLGDNPATWLEDADFAFDTTPATSFAPRGSVNYPWAGSYIKEAPGEVRINPEDVTFEGWMPKTTWEYGEYVKPSEYKANRNLYFNENAGGKKPAFPFLLKNR